MARPSRQSDCPADAALEYPNQAVVAPDLFYDATADGNSGALEQLRYESERPARADS